MELTSEACQKEIIERFEFLKVIKAHTQNEQIIAEENIELIKREIDQSVDFHLENLQKRGAWLKLHAEHVYGLMQESLAQKQEQIEIGISSITSVLEDKDSYRLSEEQACNEMKNILDTSWPSASENAVLTFSASNSALSESILAYGNIGTTLKDESESFILAEDDDGIEIIPKEQNLFPRDSVSDWLLNKSSSPDEVSEVAEKESYSDWLVCSKNDPAFMKVEPSPWLLRECDTDSGHWSAFTSSTKSEQPIEYASFLIKNLQISKKDVIDDLDKDETDMNTFLHKSSSPSDSTQNYQYPKRQFLEHWDFLNEQDSSKYLVAKKDIPAAKPKKEETCQWLYRKDVDECRQEKCTANGCDLFDKNWLRTASDW